MNRQPVNSEQTRKNRQNSTSRTEKQIIQTEAASKNSMTGTEIFRKYNSAVFMVFTSDGRKAYQGSGFFISASGIGISNYHVFEGTAIGYEQIKLSNNKFYQVKNIIARNKENDYIIFQVKSDGTNFNYIPIGNSQPKVGEKVFAIGSPRGLENTFSSGEISQMRGDNLIQISVPIDHGSSGGALINEYGNVIGITMGGYDDSGANLNFAVNINVLIPRLK
ncbi:MAG: serine protease [Prevotella sp.]|jgi:serine protease Do|nr:serine protease [Prevotella sp.]